MMAGLPVQLQILDGIDARLRVIKEAYGYSSTIKKIERARLKPFIQGDLPAINYWPGPDQLIQKSTGKETREMPVYIEYYRPTLDVPFTDMAYLLANDVSTSLYRDPSKPRVTDMASYGLGGLIDFMEVSSVTPVIGEDQSPWCGALIAVTLRYNIVPGNFLTIENY
jgi:hypothetical protein